MREQSLLLNRATFEESDFYPYRYLSSEGFFPGYNFPRLPVRAYVSGDRSLRSIDRPRFLGLAEFGPGNTLYHEGRKYRVDGVTRPPDGIEAQFEAATLCKQCGYLHDRGHIDREELDAICRGVLGWLDAADEADRAQVLEALQITVTASPEQAKMVGVLPAALPEFVRVERSCRCLFSGDK